MTEWRKPKLPRALAAAACGCLFLLAAAPCVRAAEAFQVRYNLVGTLGAEMFAPLDIPGWRASLTYSHARVDKITGDHGGPLTRAVPGGSVPLPPPAPAALYPRYGPADARLDAGGRLRQWNLGLAWLGSSQLAGGRIALGLNLPYASREQRLRPVAPTPALSWSPAVPPAARAGPAAAFDARYQQSLAAVGAAETGEATGIGDLELQAGWVRAAGSTRVIAGVALVLPTGRYDPAPGADVGFGNFYTLRPTLHVGRQLSDKAAVAAKLVLGLNSRNRDNDLRSGNWLALELAAGHALPIGVAGVQLTRLQQVQDDANNAFGPSRFRANTAGVFFAMRLPRLASAAHIQYARTLSSRNAKHGDFLQLRLSHAF